jgi:SAM-dependent methyltransferase
MNTYQEVFAYYDLVTKELMFKKKSILKTDCYNEAFKRPIITTQPAKLIEYNQKHIDLALKNNPKLNIIHGDVRKLPYKDNEFDLVMDLSTIDHIHPQDLSKVISEYNRCLMKNGTLLIIVWLTLVPKPIKSWKSTNQYFFDYDTFKKELHYFSTIRQRKLLQPPELDGAYLWEFLLKK